MSSRNVGGIDSVADSTSHLLGLAFQPYTGRLLVLDAGAGVIREVNPVDGSSRATGSSALSGTTRGRRPSSTRRQ